MGIVIRMRASALKRNIRRRSKTKLPPTRVAVFCCNALDGSSYIRLAASDIASQLYLACAKLYCPSGSLGGEYNITEAERLQYHFCIAKISLRKAEYH